MEMYLETITEPKQYLSFGIYKDDPRVDYPAPKGFVWVQGRPSETMEPYIEKSLSEKLNDIFVTLPEEAQAKYLTLKPSIILELEHGNKNIVKILINSIETTSEQEALIKQEILQKLEETV